jgi:hypothetical protein
MKIIKTCIYCKKTKLSTQFNIEHVMPRAFGHYKDNLTLHCVCKECNQYFGDNLEIIFSRDSMEALLRYHYGLKTFNKISELRQKNMYITYSGKDQWNGVRMRVEADPSGLVLNLTAQAGFTFKSSGKQYFTLEELLNLEKPIKPLIIPGSKINLISGTDEDLIKLKTELRRLDINFNKEGDFPKFDIETQNLDGNNISYKEIDLIKRTLSKIAFNYFTFNSGAKKALSSDFDMIRNYIRHGISPDYHFFMGEHPSVELEGALDQNNLFHVITQDWTKDLTGLVVNINFFNTSHYKILLTSNYHGLYSPSLTIGHSFLIDTKKIVQMQKSKLYIGSGM